jgi:hypothetical protein
VIGGIWFHYTGTEIGNQRPDIDDALLNILGNARISNPINTGQGQDIHRLSEETLQIFRQFNKAQSNRAFKLNYKIDVTGSVC